LRQANCYQRAKKAFCNIPSLLIIPKVKKLNKRKMKTLHANDKVQQIPKVELGAITK